MTFSTETFYNNISLIFQKMLIITTPFQKMSRATMTISFTSHNNALSMQSACVIKDYWLSIEKSVKSIIIDCKIDIRVGSDGF